MSDYSWQSELGAPSFGLTMKESIARPPRIEHDIFSNPIHFAHNTQIIRVKNKIPSPGYLILPLKLITKSTIFRGLSFSQMSSLGFCFWSNIYWRYAPRGHEWPARFCLRYVSRASGLIKESCAKVEQQRTRDLFNALPMHSGAGLECLRGFKTASGQLRAQSA